MNYYMPSGYEGVPLSNGGFGGNYGIDPPVLEKNQKFTSTWDVFRRYLLNFIIFLTIRSMKYYKSSKYQTNI